MRGLGQRISFQKSKVIAGLRLKIFKPIRPYLTLNELYQAETEPTLSNWSGINGYVKKNEKNRLDWDEFIGPFPLDVLKSSLFYLVLQVISYRDIATECIPTTCK